MLRRKYTGIKQRGTAQSVCGVSYVETTENDKIGITTIMKSEYQLNRFLDMNQLERVKDIRAELVSLIEAFASESQKEAEID